ncbi:DUF2493 domain-containing protein [Streptomyces sp. SAS_275]|uniref:DUF2493 domain-containing protein n=1 Tax=Streptomyces sp. SAS_275 TaxID=3412746 RepID=UPI00403CB193
MPDPYRVLVTGSRDWDDDTAIGEALSEAIRPVWHDHNVVIVHGACPSGADQMAHEWAEVFGVDVERHPADWDHCTDNCPQGHRKPKRRGDTAHPGVCADYCPSAGPRRNRELIRLGAGVCLAFIRNGSRGASHTAALAEQAGIPVRRFTA